MAIGSKPLTYGSLLVAACVLSWFAPAHGEMSENLLANPSFEEGLDTNGFPVGWSLYGARDEKRHLEVVGVPHDGELAVLIADEDPGAEIGLTQVVPAVPDVAYEASAMVRAVEDASPAGSFLQLRFLPSQQLFQVGLTARSTRKYNRVAVRGVAPPDTTHAQIYLYTHRDPTPKVMVDSVSLVSGVEPPPPPPPPPVPPQYDKLKDLHINTPLVAGGAPNVTIIVPATGAYDGLAERIQAAIQRLTGVQVPVATDTSPAGAVPITGNLIVLGNRSTNKTIEQLYNLHYCILDLKYPGPEGYNVRTVHDPFGNGYNVVLVGASDMIGMEAATNKFIEDLEAAGATSGELAVGWLMDIRLGKGIVVPTDIKEFQHWDASAMYGSSGYFGWNMISKRMAMYYMTGDEFSAREALRLAFPDQAAKDEIARIDGEMIENKDDPLAGPYHYNAHMMILFWDLIEESPIFDDATRLKVINAFARQLSHRKDEGIYGLTEPPAQVGSRHTQWSAISLYCLGRYFQTHYPSPVWAQCMRGAQLAFAPLHEHPWISGEADNLFWYNTGVAPILTYMVLTGDRKPLESGALQKLLRGQEVLLSGLVPEQLNSGSSLDYLHKAAYLTGDGRWLTYRDRTGVDTTVFRLGWSFWPDENLQPALPTDLVGKWTVDYLPEQHWAVRGNGFKPEESFYVASYRSTTDGSGDFVLVDGFNGASRNPYHTFAILELRLDGHTLLRGYHNQVLTKADGMVEPQVAMDAALKHCDVVGDTAFIVGDVPRAAFSDWQRTLVQRTGKYALVVDDLESRADSDNLEVQTLWETTGASWSQEAQALCVSVPLTEATLPGWVRVRALDQVCSSEPSGPEGLIRLDSIGIMLARAQEPGGWLEMSFSLDAPLRGEMFVDLVNYVDRGTVRILLDGEVVVPQFDHYAPVAVAQKVPLGDRELAAGQHRLRVEAMARRPGSDKCYIGLRGISIRPPGAPQVTVPPRFEIRPADVLRVTGGSLATMSWIGPVRTGQHRIFFSLIAKRVGAEPACLRIGDNAAALALPEPGLAIVGENNGTHADLAIIAQSHLFGRNLTSARLAGLRLHADNAVCVDWDFTSGKLALLAKAATKLSLAGIEPGGLSLDGQAIEAGEGDVECLVPEGRHLIEGARLPAHEADRLSSALSEAVTRGREMRTRALAMAAEPTRPTAPPLTSVFTTNVGGSVVDMITIPAQGGPLVCAAEGKTVHMVGLDGREVRALQADGDIRVLHWWPEHRLLLVGCKDEKVIAFDEAGNRKWVFTSVMDEAVFRAAKQYWFKTAPGHEGIHALHTGVFMDGKSQCFVGSACTLEILDENGQLVKRMPIFWGPGHKFALLDAPDGSVNLLIAREPTDSEALAIVNSRTLTETGRSYYTVPPGHTYVGGWACMSRDHIFDVDLNGDGAREVVSEINGTWNRVTVWNRDGSALYSATFGPGDPIPARNVRDLEVADLDGDGRQELITALSSHLVLALDWQCNKRWATRLPSPPTVLTVAGTSETARWVYAGCEDGTVAVLDNNGAVVRLGKVNGRPTRILALEREGARPTVILGTAQGELRGVAR